MNFYQNSQMTKDNTDSKLNDYLCARIAVFNQLCDDGIFRPIFIYPGEITSVKQLDPPHKIGDATANTCISYRKGCQFNGQGESGELFVHEHIWTVLSTAGAILAVNDYCYSILHSTRKLFEKNGVKYSPEPYQRLLAIDQ
jgi:hypothetical protein